MVYFKIVKGKYKGKKSIYDTINYVLNIQKNPHSVFHAYGNTPEDIKQAADSFYKVQKIHDKTSCKRIIHFILAFSPDEKHSPKEYLMYGYKFMDFFEKGTQYIFALHEKGNNGEEKYPHIHFLVNPINAKSGKRITIKKRTLHSLHKYVSEIFNMNVTFKSFPEDHV